VIEKIVTTVIAALLVAGILATFRMRRLHLYVPRLYEYSNLSDRGSLVELVLVNAGYQTEDKIQLTLRRNLHYQLVAATLPSISLADGVVSIPRLTRKQEASVVLLVEGGSFAEKDFVSGASEKGVVKIVKRQQGEAYYTPAEIAGVALLVIAFGVLMAGGAALLAGQHTKLYGRTPFEILADAFTPGLAEWRKKLAQEGWEGIDGFFDHGYFEHYAQGGFVVENVQVTRRGESIDATLTLINPTPKRLEIAVSLDVPREFGSDKLTFLAERSWSGLVPSNERRTIKLRYDAKPNAAGKIMAKLEVRLARGGVGQSVWAWRWLEV